MVVVDRIVVMAMEHPPEILGGFMGVAMLVSHFRVVANGFRGVRRASRRRR